MGVSVGSSGLFDIYAVYHPFLEAVKGPALPWLLVSGVGVYIVFFVVTWIYAPPPEMGTGEGSRPGSSG